MQDTNDTPSSGYFKAAVAKEAKVRPESGPLRAVHLSRHKWPGGNSQLGSLTVE